MDCRFRGSDGKYPFLPFPLSRITSATFDLQMKGLSFSHL